MNANSLGESIKRLREKAVIIVPIVTFALLLIFAWHKRAAFVPSPATSPPTAEQWVQLNGPFDGKINALLIESPSGVHTLFAGTNGGVFKSEDQGKSWIPCNNGLNNRLVRALAVDPDNPNVLYAGTWNGKVHISKDAGASWQERSHGLPPYEIRALAVHTYNPHKLYVGMPAGVYTTTDGGEVWRPATEFTGTLQCMAVDLEHPDTIYVGTAANGIYKSIDGGATWFSLRTVFTNVSSLVILPRSTRTIYAISGGKIYRSENAGLLWTYLDSYRDPSVACCLAVNLKNEQEVYVGLQDGLYKSTDARESWFRSDTGLQKVAVRILVVDPIETNTIYACSGNQLFASTDAGRTWQQRSAINASSAANILALHEDPKEGAVFYASVAGGGLYKTTDGGAHWQHIGEKLPAAQITAIEVDPINTRRVYVGVSEGFVFKSNDGGTTWAPAGGVTEALISALAIDPEQPNRIYAGTLGCGFFRSDDEGWHWIHRGEGTGKNVQRIVVDPKGPQTTLYILTEKGVFRSSDAGENWELYLSQASDIAPAVRGSLKPIVVTHIDPDHVTGSGVTEATIVPRSNISSEAELKELTASPIAPQTIYVLAQGQGVFQSTDAGKSWALLGSGLESCSLQTLALSADDPNLILVGTDMGIYRYQPAK